MKDFSNWLEAWKNYPPVPDWLNILGTIVIGVLLVLMAVGIIVGFIGAFLRDSLLFVRIIFISLVSGLIGVLLVMCISDLIDNYYEQRSTAPPTIREQISKVWNLDDIDCDFSSKEQTSYRRFEIRRLPWRQEDQSHTARKRKQTRPVHTGWKTFPNQIGRI